MLSKQIFLLFQLTACAYVLTYPDAAAHDFPDRKVTKSSSIQAKKRYLEKYDFIRILKIWLSAQVTTDCSRKTQFEENALY